MPRARFDRLSPDKRARILEAAFDEFARHGLDSASTNRIASEAGVSKSLLFYYFDDKQDLFATVVGEVSRELLGALAPPTVPPTDAASFWAAFEALYRQLLNALEQRPSVRAFVIAFVRTQSMSVDNPLLAEAVAGTTAVFEQMIAIGKRAGAIREDLPAPLLLHLLRTVALAVDEWLLREGPGALEPATIIDLYRRLLGPRDVATKGR